MKRFYKQAEVAPVAAGWQVQLDGRGVKTPGGKAQIVPTHALAEALAAEWAGQGEEIDPSAFVLRDLADYAIDVVAPDPAAAVAGLMPYAETDTLCYRAAQGDPLTIRQFAMWEPILAKAETQWGVQFERVEGIIHRRQPAPTLEALEAMLAAQGTFTLAALRTLASLAASLTIALLAAAGEDPDALWSAAELEEEFQAERWGRDAEAAQRSTNRRTAFLAAVRFAELARPSRA